MLSIIQIIYFLKGYRTGNFSSPSWPQMKIIISSYYCQTYQVPTNPWYYLPLPYSSSNKYFLHFPFPSFPPQKNVLSFFRISKCHISFVDLRWAQLYVSLVWDLICRLDLQISHKFNSDRNLTNIRTWKLVSIVLRLSTWQTVQFQNLVEKLWESGGGRIWVGIERSSYSEQQLSDHMVDDHSCQITWMMMSNSEQ